MTPTAQSISLRLIILLASLNALVAAAIDMYLPAYPAIGADLQISAGQVQQTLTVFLVGLAVGQGVYGPLLDRYGRRHPLLVGVLLFTLGSALAALAHSFELLLLARFIQALGAAAGSVTPRAIVADTCDVDTAARVFSMLMQIMMIAPITAPIIGGAMLLVGPWQLIFWVLVVAGVLSGLFSLRMLPETLPVDRRVPISIRGILRNYFKLLAHPRFLLFTLASSFTVGALFTYISNSPFVFIQQYGLSPGQYSLVFAASASAMILTGQINLRLLRLYKPLEVLYMGLAGLIGASATLGVLVLTGLADVWSYAVILGLGLSMLGMITGKPDRSDHGLRPTVCRHSFIADGDAAILVGRITGLCHQPHARHPADPASRHDRLWFGSICPVLSGIPCTLAWINRAARTRANSTMHPYSRLPGHKKSGHKGRFFIDGQIRLTPGSTP